MRHSGAIVAHRNRDLRIVQFRVQRGDIFAGEGKRRNTAHLIRWPICKENSQTASRRLLADKSPQMDESLFDRVDSKREQQFDTRLHSFESQ